MRPTVYFFVELPSRPGIQKLVAKPDLHAVAAGGGKSPDQHTERPGLSMVPVP